MQLPSFLPSSYQAVKSASAKRVSWASLGSTSHGSSSASGGQRGFLKSWPQRTFLGVVVVEAVFVVLVSALALRSPWWRWHLDDSLTKVVFLVMSSMIILAVDAFRTSNIVSLLAVSFFNIPMLVYHIYLRVTAREAYFDHTNNPRGIPCPPDDSPRCIMFRAGWKDCIAMLTAAPIVIALSQVVYTYLTWVLASEFGWANFRLLGADRRLKYLRAWEQRLQTLLRVDFAFTAIYAVYNTLHAVQVLRDVDTSFSSHVVVIVVLVLQYLLLLAPLIGLLAMWREWDLLMYTVLGFLALGTGALVPLVWVFLYGPRSDNNWYSRNFRAPTIVLSAFDATLVFFTVCLGVYLVHFQFGEGLREAKERGQAAHAPPSGQTIYKRWSVLSRESGPADEETELPLSESQRRLVIE